MPIQARPTLQSLQLAKQKRKEACLCKCWARPLGTGRGHAWDWRGWELMVLGRNGPRCVAPPGGRRPLPKEPPQFVPANVGIPKRTDLICAQEDGTLDLTGKPLHL